MLAITPDFNDGLIQFKDNNSAVIRDLWTKIKGGNPLEDIAQLLYNQVSYEHTLSSPQRNQLYAKIDLCTGQHRNQQYDNFFGDIYDPFLTAFNALMDIFHKIKPTTTVISTTYNDIYIKSHTIRYQDIRELADKYYSPTLFLQIPFIMELADSSINNIWLYGDIVGGI